MKLNYSELENVFLFVSTAPRFMNAVTLSKETGEIYYLSEMGDSDDLRDDFVECNQYIEIPHKS